jgi:hypothetical protein
VGIRSGLIADSVMVYSVAAFGKYRDPHYVQDDDSTGMRDRFQDVVSGCRKATSALWLSFPQGICVCLVVPVLYTLCKFALEKRDNDQTRGLQAGLQFAAFRFEEGVADTVDDR